MHISIGRNTENNMKLLGITAYPFSEQVLKSNYRVLAFKYHPDHNPNNEEALKKFRKITEAYEALSPLASCVTPEQVNQELLKQEKAKEDIFELYDTCPKCEGLTYWFEDRLVYDNKLIKSPCILCRKIPCKKCDNGIFTLKSGIKVTCLNCGGKGVLIDRKCRWCMGRGNTSYNYHNEKVKIECMRCNGTGKVKIDPFNPVIPKGGIMV